MIIDSFGSQKCVPPGGKDRGPLMQARKAEAADSASPSPARNPVEAAPPRPQTDEGDWKQRDTACRRQVDKSLSSPYGIYAQCMEEKGGLVPANQSGQPTR
jgi:hypothetical protein